MELAPIVLFTYNRPWHTERTLQALSDNEYALESDLYVFCDGPKAAVSEEQMANIARVREVARSRQWCKSVTVIEAEKNKGLANSIISGVTDVIEKHGKVIVLEDDLVTSKWFLKYMNKALDYYEDRPGVMSISANRPPMDKMDIPTDYEFDVFASLRSYSTGWATWKDRWKRVDWSLDYLEEFLKHPEQVKAFNRCGDDMTEMLIDQRDGRIDSWAIQFSFAHFYQHAVAILPCVPYVDNIGFDGSGIHSGIENRGLYRNDLALCPTEPRLVDVLYEDKRIINAFYNVYCQKRRPIWQKAANYLSRKFNRKPPFVIKKKVFE